MAFYLDGNNFVQPPTLGEYKVVYFKKGGTARTIAVDFRADVNDTVIIDVEEDGEYTFKVYFANSDFSRSRVAISTCTMETNTRGCKIYYLNPNFVKELVEFVVDLQYCGFRV